MRESTDKFVWELEPRLADGRRGLMVEVMRSIANNDATERKVRAKATQMMAEDPIWTTNAIAAAGIYVSYPFAGPQRRYKGEVKAVSEAQA